MRPVLWLARKQGSEGKKELLLRRSFACTKSDEIDPAALGDARFAFHPLHGHTPHGGFAVVYFDDGVWVAVPAFIDVK
jgi:hypothetical protein